jgi:hypothetical protein
MICHVCHDPAIGQCKKCSKFYCPQHGDVECVKCREALQTTPAAPSIDVRLPEYGGPGRPSEQVYAGTTCHLCKRPAAGACGGCGRFYCPGHQGQPGVLASLSPYEDYAGRALCAECQQRMNARSTCGCVFGVIVLIMVLMLALVFSSGFR